MRFLGLRSVDVAEGDVTVGMPASRWLTNWGSGIYGGAIAFLAECSMGAAVLSTLPPATADAPLDLKGNFLRPVRPHRGELTAQGKVIHKGRAVAIVHGEVCAQGKVVAVANATALVLPGRIWGKPVHVADEVVPPAE